jgi:histidinol phosphatase-like PHP family hydrolase
MFLTYKNQLVPKIQIYHDLQNHVSERSRARELVNKVCRVAGNREKEVLINYSHVTSEGNLLYIHSTAGYSFAVGNDADHFGVICG